MQSFHLTMRGQRPLVDIVRTTPTGYNYTARRLMQIEMGINVFIKVDYKLIYAEYSRTEVLSYLHRRIQLSGLYHRKLL